MKTKTFELARPVRGVLFVFGAVVFFLAATCPASAQWNTGNVEAAWTGFNNHFYNLDPNDHTKAYYYEIEGQTAEEGFWTFAEEIEMAIDAAYWDATNNPSNETADKNRVVALCNGFRAQHTDNWSSDPYDDDLSVAVLAFVRCYQLTGNASCLTDAENNFNTVYNRGYDTVYGGGLWWNYQWNTPGGGASYNKSSSANWTFVIAGRLLYNVTSESSYETKADTIYDWAISNLYDSSSGQVYNDIEGALPGAPNKGLVTYNFGLAIGAANEESKGSTVTTMGTYLVNNVQDPTRAQVNGYNILPNYGQANNGFGAFNGMTFRWTGIASGHGLMPSNYVAWAQQNLSLAWADRNSTALSWDDWIPDPPATTSPITPSTGLRGIDCTPMVVGMLFVPPPS